jgi:hypothetical protein
VAPTPNATMESVLAYLNTKAILTEGADLNAFSTTTVRETRLASEINVKIRVPELADKMQNVLLLITYRLALASKDTSATLSYFALQYHLLHHKTHAVRHLAVPTVNAEKLMVKLCVLAYLASSVVLQAVDLSAFPVQSVL